MPGIILGNYEIKLFKIEPLIRLSLMRYKTGMHQAEESLVVHVFTDCARDLLQLLEPYVTLFFGVIQGENSLETIFCFVFTDPCADAVNELFKIERFVLFTKGCYDFLDEWAAIM
jgi:hypothetical protein